MELKNKSLQAIVMRLEASGAARDVMANAIVELARILDDTRDSASVIGGRLAGEIAERSQRQLEITGRIAALERRMSMAEVVVTPNDKRGMATPFEDTRIAELERELANARADAQVHQSARQTLEKWEAKLLEAFNIPPSEAGAHNRKWMIAEVGRLQQRSGSLSAAGEERQRLIMALSSQDRTISAVGMERDRNEAKVRDLEAQVAALQKAIDDVWALVEQPDGYGSPYWTEPGLDDTTPAQAIERVLASLRTCVRYWIKEQERPWPAYREAMAALNAADRQSDDDQICGC